MDTIDWIESDELRLRQVLVNLLSNAVKFTPDGGRVDVMTELVGNELVITVQDNGPGIARDDWKQIFEAFQQGRRGAPSEGTGLGLTLCRKIAALLQVDESGSSPRSGRAAPSTWQCRTSGPAPKPMPARASMSTAADPWW